MSNRFSRLTRRGFLLGAGAAVGWLGRLGWDRVGPSFSGHTSEVARPAFGMPGPYRGRVVEVHHPDSVGSANKVNADAVRTMMDRGMCDLTGADCAGDAWRRFFSRGDVVGIKVNPVGFKKPSDVPWSGSSISSPEVLIEVVNGLKGAGVKPQDIIVFERYATEFRNAGYEAVLRERAMTGVRWYASSARVDSLDIQGLDTPGDHADPDPHVVGYDPDHFVHMGFANVRHEEAKDERRFRSHVSLIVSRMINKLITIPCLKDHRSAGVTLALKNLSHGLNNNVSRSHISGVYVHAHADASNPNQCNTFIPTAAGQRIIREKATLHILDGLIGVYEGGPGSWNATWRTWPYRSLFFATDPVALDHVGWDIIDTKRAEEGWQPVAAMGKYFPNDLSSLSNRLATLGMAAALAGRPLPGNQETEQFDRRQPEHVILAGTIGMGVFDQAGIEHRRVELKA